jgi:Tol biopolymer transport system component
MIRWTHTSQGVFAAACLVTVLAATARCAGASTSQTEPMIADPVHDLIGAASLPGHAAVASAGAILFTSDREGSSGLYLVNADGSGLRRLVREGDDASWSPDGDRIAFLGNSGDTEGFGFNAVLKVVQANGLGLRQVSPSNADSYSWSPDGSRLSWVEIFAGRDALWVVNADGTGEKRIVPEDATDPAWSPDGRTIAFILERQLEGDLFLVDVASGEQRLLVRDAHGAPAWSPDGSKIVFIRETPTFDEDLYVANSNGSGVRKLTITPADYELKAQWSPDGGAIAFSGSFKGRLATYVVKADGSGRHLVGRGSGMSWSPDGGRLALERNGDVWVISSNGSGRRRVTQGERYGYGNVSPRWHPRGARSEQLGGVAVSPEIPTDSITKPGLLQTRARIHRLAADGGRVAIAYDQSPNCLELWQPRVNRLTRFAEKDSCGDSGEGGLLELTLAHSRLAWLTYETGIHLHLYITTATIAQRQPRGVMSLSTGGNISCARPSSCAFAGVGDLRGGDTALVFDTWNVHGTRCESVDCFRARKVKGVLWRLQRSRARRIRSEPAGLTAMATDGQRVAALRSDGRLEILGANGRLLASLAIPGPVRGASLSRRHLVVLTNTQLLAYTIGTRKIERRWSLARTSAERKLAGVAGELVAYTEGRTIRLLRLTDGRRRTLQVEGVGQVRAALTSAGLFYAYAVKGSDHPGRVAFVAADALR